MIIDVGEKANIECKLNIGTHNGIFHSDEVVGVAILELAYAETDTRVVRTRNPEELNKLDIVIDVGGGKFDHHVAGFCVCRKTGEKYASAGLVWAEFAEKVIKTVMTQENIVIGGEKICEVKDQIDTEVILPVDMEDNGEKISNHIFSFISKFLPTWLETAIYDQAFYKVERIVRDILREIIKDKIVQIVTKTELKKRFDSIDDGILEIPAQTMPWLEEVVSYNQGHSNSIKFVIFPYPAGGWAVQCVPPSIEEKFAQLVPFPKEWAGGNESTLPEISSIQDSTFCHNGCFFARGRTKEAVLEMCKVAMRKAR